MIQASCFCHKGENLGLRDTVVTHSPSWQYYSSCRIPEVSFVLETFKEI